MKELNESQKRAEEALQNANVKVLKELFDQSQKDIEAILGGLSVMLDHKKLGPLPNDDGILAMRDVSLAAIALARDVAIQKATEIVACR